MKNTHMIPGTNLPLPSYFYAFGGGEDEGDAGGDAGGGDAPVSVVNADGSFTEDWHAPFGEENKAYLSRYKKFDDFVNSSISTKKLVGKPADQLAEIPNEHSSDEVRAAFARAGGKPDTIDGYSYEMPAELTAKLGALDDTKMAAFKDFAHTQNWNQKQFKEALDFYHTNISDDTDAFTNQMAENKAARGVEGNQVLTQLFKDEAGSRKVRANALLDKYGLDTLKMPDGTESSIKGELLAENPNLLESPYLILLMDKFAGSLGEDTLKGMGLGPASASVADVEAKIAELRAHPGANDKSHAQYKDIQRQLEVLYQKKTA